MPASRKNRGFFPSLPRDHFQRKRVIRRIGNISFIIIFSIVVAYILTRPVGGKGFSLPKSSQGAAKPSVKSPPAPVGDTVPQATPAAGR